jgi:hypothetical protein
MFKTAQLSLILSFSIIVFVVGAAEDCSNYLPLTEPVHPTERPSETCEGTDLGSAWGNYERTMVLDMHNYYRSQLAHGCSAMPNSTYAPPARNMKKFTYNCSLEATAKAWADQCLWQHSTSTFRKGAGENMYMRTVSASTTQDLTTSIFFLQTNAWWRELELYGGVTADNTSLRTDIFSQIGHWSAMSWAATYSVGCGVSKCPEGDKIKYIGVCQYWPAGNVGNQQIYDIGNHCKVNADCTLPMWRKCDSDLGLCEPSEAEDEPSFPCQGKETGAPFKDNMRKFVENKINQYRSELAAGKNLKADGTFAPKAINMPKVTYNCDLEKLAQTRSSTCPAFAPPSDETIFQELTRDWQELKPDYYIPIALEKWWSELGTAAASSNITETSTKFQSYSIRNWAQMASQKTIEIGCGYSACINQYKQTAHTVVCKYYQNVTYFSNLYTVGNPCSQDSECTLDGHLFCDTSLGLCSKYEVTEAPILSTTTTLKMDTTTAKNEEQPTTTMSLTTNEAVDITTTTIASAKSTTLANVEASTTSGKPITSIEPITTKATTIESSTVEIGEEETTVPNPLTTTTVTEAPILPTTTTLKMHTTTEGLTTTQAVATTSAHIATEEPSLASTTSFKVDTTTTEMPASTGQPATNNLPTTTFASEKITTTDIAEAKTTSEKPITSVEPITTKSTTIQSSTIDFGEQTTPNPMTTTTKPKCDCYCKPRTTPLLP